MAGVTKAISTGTLIRQVGEGPSRRQTKALNRQLEVELGCLWAEGSRLAVKVKGNVVRATPVAAALSWTCSSNTEASLMDHWELGSSFVASWRHWGSASADFSNFKGNWYSNCCLAFCSWPARGKGSPRSWLSQRAKLFQLCFWFRGISFLDLAMSAMKWCCSSNWIKTSADSPSWYCYKEKNDGTEVADWVSDDSLF